MEMDVRYFLSGNGAIVRAEVVAADGWVFQHNQITHFSSKLEHCLQLIFGQFKRVADVALWQDKRIQLPDRKLVPDGERKIVFD